MSVAALAKHIWRRMWDRYAIKYGIVLWACLWATSLQLQYRIQGNYLLVFMPVIGFTLSLLSCVFLVSVFLDYGPHWDRARRFLKWIEWSVNVLVGLFVCASLLIYANGYQDISTPMYRFGEIVAYHREATAYPWVTVRYRDAPASTVNVILNANETNELWGAEPILVTQKAGAYGIPLVLKIEKDWDSYSREILKRTPTATAIWRRLVFFNLEHHRISEGISAAQEYLKIRPQDHETAFLFGSNIFYRGKAPQSIEFLEHAVAQHPTYDYYQFLGTALNWAGQGKRAAEVLEASIPLRPEDWEAYYHLGYVYRGLGKPKEAIEWFEKALQRRPDFPEASDAIAKMKKTLN